MIEHSGPTIDLAVNGTLMRGLELNDHMIDIGATFLTESRTAAEYRLWSIGDVHPAMIRTSAGDGASIAVEVWRIPIEGMASLLLSEPRGLAIGKVRLHDDTDVLGVIGEPTVVEGQPEITEFGGWRAYIESTIPIGGTS